MCPLRVPSPFLFRCWQFLRAFEDSYQLRGAKSQMLFFTLCRIKTSEICLRVLSYLLKGRKKGRKKEKGRKERKKEGGREEGRAGGKK